MEQRHEHRVERVLTRPAKPQTRQRYTDLRHGEQFFRLCEKRQRHFRAGVAAFRKMAQLRIPHREQRDFGRSEERVDHEYQAEQQQARDIVAGGGHLVIQCRGLEPRNRA